MTPEQFLSQPTTPYSDWFGSGDTHSDYHEALGAAEPPLEVLQSGCMLCLVWLETVIVTGYDGSEYCHSWVFERKGGPK